jgi:hypothetical protein
LARLASPRVSVPVVVASTRRLAQGTPRRASAPPAPSSSASAPPPAVQKLSFEDDFVSGELAGPDDIGLVSLTTTTHASLIELRWQLIAELVETFEDL